MLVSCQHLNESFANTPYVCEQLDQSESRPHTAVCVVHKSHKVETHQTMELVVNNNSF